MKKAIFPGSFDPFTIGHYDIVKRGLELFDEIIIGIGQNCNKKSMFSIEERLSAIQNAFKNEPRVKVQVYSCLTIDFAQEVGAQFILRGVRSVQDFEYERSMADANKELGNIETVLLYSSPKYSHISSTLVRDLLTYNKDIKSYIP